MWMRGSYNDGSEFSSTIQDSFGPGRKLRPLMPRPMAATAACTFYGHDQLLTLNHHFAMVEQSKREVMGGSQQVVVSARWNPTPEQVQTLEELYRRGTRTPSAEQIQQITAQLRRYGKIEGKNVFYWFQNHKARERQKRRRQNESLSDELKRDSSTGVNKRGYEVEQAKNWVSPTSSRTIAEKTSTVASAEAESKSGWLQLDDADSESQHLLTGKNATWQQTMHLSSSPITSSSDIVTTVRTTPDTSNNNNHNYTNPAAAVHTPRLSFVADDKGAEYAQTLQLFPIQNNEDEGKGDDEEDKSSNYQFFEFLPLKN